MEGLQSSVAGVNVILAGQVMVGGVKSTRLTVKEHVPVLPLPSSTVNITVVIPTPDKIELPVGDWVRVSEETQLSVATALVAKFARIVWQLALSTRF